MQSTRPKAQTEPGPDYLVSLPLELQVLILSLVPPQRIFSLRRVSRSWCTMLCNPHLLDALNKSLPFFTSAPDFGSRIKRRMRMARGEPVWVKSFPEAFPTWGLQIPMSYRGSKSRIRFWNGWIVMLYFKTEKRLGGRDFATYTTELILRMRNLAQSNINVEVDMLDLLKRLHPTLYIHGIDEQIPVDYVNPNITYGKLLVQDGKIIVGLNASSEYKTTYPGVRYRRRPVMQPPVVYGVYFFIFNITTGDLVHHFQAPAPPLDTYDDLLIVRLINSYLFTINYTQNTEPEISRPSRNDNCMRYRINAYCLGENRQDCLGGAWAPEIVIMDPTADWYTAFDVMAADRKPKTCIARLAAFDPQGRVWFPYFPEGRFLSHLPADENGRNNSTEHVQGTTSLSIPMRDLARSSCQRWCIFPAVIHRSWAEKYQYIPPIINVAGSVETRDNSQCSRSRSGSTNIGHQELLKETDTSNTMLDTYNQFFYSVYFTKPNPDTSGAIHGTINVRRLAHSPLGTHFKVLAPIEVDFNRAKSLVNGSDHNIFKRPYTACLDDDSIVQRTSVLWGYISNLTNLAVDETSGVRFSDRFVRINLCENRTPNNLYLVPFHEEDSQPADGFAIGENDMKKGEGYWVRNCLPADAAMMKPGSGPYGNDSSSQVEVDWAFGDDGLTAWVVKRSGTEVSPVTTTTTSESELWLVCYEENWVI